MSVPSSAFLNALASSLQRSEARYLVPTVAATALGQGTTWAPAIYRHECDKLPQAPPSPSQAPINIAEDQIPRRVVLRKMKEALVKSTILVGVPRVIETMLHLNEAVGDDAQDHTFVREEWETLEGREILRRGDEALERVYRDDIKRTFAKRGPGMQDIRLISRFLTYGTLLHPIAPSAPLSLQETEIVILSTLVPQRTPREILCHLRGSLRSGIVADEVEEIHSAIERVCEELGVKDIGKGMPRVADLADEAP